jgi:hypothetical protein
MSILDLELVWGVHTVAFIGFTGYCKIKEIGVVDESVENNPRIVL